MRLYEANMEARKQSKLSHELANKYYEKGTREIQLKKGDFVYLYNHKANRGRAKTFEYKYLGSCMILEKISPLIYKLQIEEDKMYHCTCKQVKTSVRGPQLHRDASGTDVNRLKRAYEGPKLHRVTSGTDVNRLKRAYEGPKLHRDTSGTDVNRLKRAYEGPKLHRDTSGTDVNRLKRAYEGPKIHRDTSGTDVNKLKRT
jgi:hypothetical protein